MSKRGKRPGLRARSKNSRDRDSEQRAKLRAAKRQGTPLPGVAVELQAEGQSPQAQPAETIQQAIDRLGSDDYPPEGVMP